MPQTEVAVLTRVTETPGCGVRGTWREQPVALGRASWLGQSGDELILMIGTTCVPLSSEQNLREGVETLVGGLKELDTSAEIVSGDTEAKTAALARRIGFEHWHSAVSPEEKAQYVKNTAQNKAVCMVGDGINDTAALASATVSIAPGSGLDASRNAADIVMIGNALGQLPMIMKVARKTVQLSKQNFGIAILYNVIAVPIAIFGLATPLIAALAMSASSITVLANAMRVKV